MREVKTYSEAFKREIAGKVEQGVYTSMKAEEYEKFRDKIKTLWDQFPLIGKTGVLVAVFIGSLKSVITIWPYMNRFIEKYPILTGLLNSLLANSIAIVAGLIAGSLLRQFMPRYKLHRIKKLLDKRDAKRAQEMTSRLLLNNPEGKLGAEVVSVRGKAFIGTGDFERALKCAKDAINKQQDLADAYLVLGRMSADIPAVMSIVGVVVYIITLAVTVYFGYRAMPKIIQTTKVKAGFRAIEGFLHSKVYDEAYTLASGIISPSDGTL